MCSAAILAGGRARRLGGRDKSALLIGEMRIIDRQILALRQVVDYIQIVTSDRERYAALGLPVVDDLMPGCGALGGLYTAIMTVPTPQTLVVACDLPFLTTPFLRHLIAVGRDADAAIPRTADGYQPLCASYSRQCADPIRRRIEAGTLTVMDVLSDVRVREIGPEELAAYDPEGMLFLNVNTPEDFARAAHLAESREL